MQNTSLRINQGW